MDQHLKVVRETTWEARAKWKCLGEQLGVTMGKLEVKTVPSKSLSVPRLYIIIISIILVIIIPYIL